MYVPIWILSLLIGACIWDIDMSNWPPWIVWTWFTLSIIWFGSQLLMFVAGKIIDNHEEYEAKELIKKRLKNTKNF